MRKVKLALLFVLKILGVFHLARWLSRNRLGILCYHGFELDDEATFRPKLFIKPGRFEQRLKTIQRYGFRVLPLEEAVERLYSGTLPTNALVITVDDGFYSFKHLAVQYLRRYGYAATVYVTTYYVQHAYPIFRLVVQYMLWKTRERELKLENVPWSENRVVNLADPTQVEYVMWNCINYGEGLRDEMQRCAIAEQLGGLLGTPYNDIVRSKALSLMSPEELRALPGSRISVELHTHRHRFPGDDRPQAEREIDDNRAALKDWFDEEKRHFCYPSGLWNERHADWLDDMGVKSSTTCVSGMNTRNTPRHALRRFLDGENIHQLEFEAALCGFPDLISRIRIQLFSRYGASRKH
jgi:peptidoglycan/xylan/chitin deacetylase (PgdA/CDA1 family)